MAVGWQSPITGLVQIDARLADAHPECGNGQEWFIQHRTNRKVGNLWRGEFATAGSAKMPPAKISVSRGELVSLVLGPRNGSHACDLTDINLVITELSGENRTWDLVKDASGDIHSGNPHADSHGNKKTWHFYKGEMKSVNQVNDAFVSVPAGSLLARWQGERDAVKQTEVARQVQALATGDPPAEENSPDGVLYEQLMNSAMAPHNLAALLAGVEADERFGKHPLGHAMKSSELVVQAPSVVEFRIPSKLAFGRTFVATGRLDAKDGREGSVILEAATSRIEPTAIALASPVVVNDGSEASKRVDAVLADARNFRRDISKLDRQKLDEYLNSVREVETRIGQADKRGELQGWRPMLTGPNVPRPKAGYPQDIVEHMRLMCDILVLAFQTDTTRVCTLKLNSDHGTLRFPHLGVDYMIHHLLSHSDTDDWLKVNQFFLEQLAYIAKRLDSIQEGERTALDNSMIMLCSSMLNGHHDATKLPVVMVGGGGGKLRGGPNLDYLDNSNRQMCRLYLSMMDKMGVHLDKFGDATEPLAEV